MSVTVIFDYDHRDHYAALREVTKRTYVRWLTLAFVLVIALMAIWTVWSGLRNANLLSTFLGAVPWFILLIFWILFVPLWQRRIAKKLPKLDPGVIGPQKRGVDQDGFHYEGNGVKLDLPWHVMFKAEETSRFFLFFYNKNCAYYIPKRVTTPEQGTEIRTMMKSALGDKAIVLP